MRKMVIAALCLMFFATAGCGTQQKDRPSVYDKGLAIVASLSEELNEEYVSYFSSYGGITDIVKELEKQDYSEPESVCQIQYADGGLKLFLTFVVGEPAKEIPDAVLDRVTGFSYLANMINARMGSDYLALSSILTAEELFVNEAVTEDITYIYFYKDAYPVIVSFNAGEDGAVHAVGNYIFSDDLKEHGADVLTETTDEPDLQMFLQLFEITQIQ